MLHLLKGDYTPPQALNPEPFARRLSGDNIKRRVLKAGRFASLQDEVIQKVLQADLHELKSKFLASPLMAPK